MENETAKILVSGWAHDSGIFPGLPGVDEPVSLTTLEDLAASAPSPPQASAFARGLIKLLSQSPEPATLIGWSTGAMAALETAALVPEKIARLVLISPTPKFCADDTWESGFPEANVRAMITGMRRAPEATLKRFFKLAARPLRLPEEQILARLDRILEKDLKRLAGQLKYLINTDLRPDMKGLTMPTLILHGEKDALIPFAAGQWLADNLPDARLVSYPSQGHSIPLTIPNRLTRQINAFI